MTTPHRTLREAAQMALDALLTGYHQGTQDAITALREALTAPEPEPVMEFKGRRLTPEGTRECWGMLLCKPEQDPARGALLYAAPPAATVPTAPVVPLTDGRITAIANELAFGGGHCNVYELARAIEQAHGIGTTGGGK